MTKKLLHLKKLKVAQNPPYDPLQAFVRENHIALEGRAEGPLSGLVFAAKDVFKILGSTFGNGHPKYLETNTPDDFTSSAIVKLLENGADLVGKTVCDELCYSISGENWHYGSPLNPHDTRRFTGGSSSGSAAATAGGLVDFALGSDCLGSVRVPASYNGVIGIRPSLARIANDGEASYCESMDVLGYVASEPDVFEKVSALLLGKDSEDFTLKTLVVATDAFDMLGAEEKEAVKPAIKTISKHFDEVIYQPLMTEGQSFETWADNFRYVQGYEVWESYGGWFRKNKPTVSEGPAIRLEFASTITINQYEKACRMKDKFTQYINKYLGRDVVVLMPTAPTVAPMRTDSEERINKVRQLSSQLLCVSPLTGIPQITLPLSQLDDVPFGLSLLAPFNSDAALVKVSMEILRD
ncbi:amidase [Allofustis seminis]|uniref:amidase n=1 Tax=Allofustis seminis TaxID=166939 RepID=UPI00037150FB|nr:amidase [Allofustis seminis]